MEEMWPIVEAQHGVFARRQANERGVGRRTLEGLVRLGVIELVTRRVFRAQGAPQTAEQALMIRVLDAGAGAAASRRAAGWLWGLPGFVPGVHDVVRRRDLSSRSSIGGDHWPRLLPEHHLTVVRGIVVTTLARTIFDIAAMPQYVGRLGRIIDTVHGRAPSILVALHQMLPEVAERGRNGITAVRTELAIRPPGTLRLTGLERKFEHILTAAGLAVPRKQIDIGGHSWIGRVDYIDDDILVIYEIDSLTHHSSLSDRRNDELRDAAAIAAGFREVVRIGEEHVWYEPHLVSGAVRDARRRHRRAA